MRNRVGLLVLGATLIGGVELLWAGESPVAAGQTVEITAVEGMTLRVRPADIDTETGRESG